MGRKRGWTDEEIGAKHKNSEPELDLGDFEDDEEMNSLLEELDAIEPEEKPKKAAKKTKKKAVKRKTKVEDEPEDEADDPDFDKPKPEKPRRSARKKKAKKRAKTPEEIQADHDPTYGEGWAGTNKKRPKKARKKAKPEISDDDLEASLALLEDQGGAPTTATQEAAKELGVDPALECPVCRTLEKCDCTEDDRSFVRRCRFEQDVHRVARCPRSGAPLSVLYVPRPGAEPPFDLKDFTAVYASVVHNGTGIATIALAHHRHE